MSNRALEFLKILQQLLNEEENNGNEVESKKIDETGKNQTVVDYKDSPLRFKGYLGGTK